MGLHLQSLSTSHLAITWGLQNLNKQKPSIWILKQLQRKLLWESISIRTRIYLHGNGRGVEESGKLSVTWENSRDAKHIFHVSHFVWSERKHLKQTGCSWKAFLKGMQRKETEPNVYFLSAPHTPPQPRLHVGAWRSPGSSRYFVTGTIPVTLSLLLSVHSEVITETPRFRNCMLSSDGYFAAIMKKVHRCGHLSQDFWLPWDPLFTGFAVKWQDWLGVNLYI